jgi:hypothetical protein
MTLALAGTPDEWYKVPTGIHQVGENYFLPGTESLPATLAQPWPQCKLPDHYNPYTLTYSQLTVDGVSCVLNAPKPATPPPAPSASPTPSPEPSATPKH